MPKEVYVFPRDARGRDWIVGQHAQIDHLFRMNHRGGDPEVSKYHPHGVLLEEAPPDARDPDEPEVYLYIGAHWSRTHESQTKEDVRKVLESLGADLSELDIQGTSDMGDEG